MNEKRDISLILERLEYEDSFLSVPEADVLPYPEDLVNEHDESFDYIISDEDGDSCDSEMPVFRNEREMEIYFYDCNEDECWCDEYEPEFDPFDSLDELPYDF